MRHYIKAEERWRRRISANEKNVEIRYDDRDYQAGDLIVLQTEQGGYSGIERRITHVLRGGQYGLEEGYVALSLEDSRVSELPSLRREVERLTRSNRSLRAHARRLRRGGKA